MKIKFYGTRGSLPAPLNAKQVQDKINDIAEGYSKYVLNETQKLAINPVGRVLPIDAWLNLQPFHLRATYGGETTCCVVEEGDTHLVFDMGSGLRKFGNDLTQKMFKNKKGYDVHFFMSHVHWDHTQGFPFFTPLFFPKSQFDTNLFLYGGTTWGKKLEEVLAGQMDAPVFPVEFEKIRKEGPSIEFPETVYNGFEKVIREVTAKNGYGVMVKASRLHHPNETYGWRVTINSGIGDSPLKTFVYATDTEPYPHGPDKALVELAKDADVLYMDGQYYRDQYLGKPTWVQSDPKNPDTGKWIPTGPPRTGWGHSDVESCAELAVAANVKRLIIGHHDPASSDERIWQNEQLAKKIFPNTECAFDGLEIEL